MRKVWVMGLLCGAAAVLPAVAAQAADAVPDMSGVWARTTFGLEQPASGRGPLRNVNRQADENREPDPAAIQDMKLMLKPAAAETVLSRITATRAGKPPPTPSSTCWPMVAPAIYRVQEMQLLQSKDHVTFIYMQDHEVRRVRLNATHPEHVTPTWHGDSVGHYEGDTLVIDTVGAKVGPVPVIDQAGSPYSEALHVVERYRLIDNDAARQALERNIEANGPPLTQQAAGVDLNYKGKGLRVEFTVEDPNVFNMPWSGIATYGHADGLWVENVCAENLREYYNNRDTSAPKADKPDF
jgi:hypothetical protein